MGTISTGTGLMSGLDIDGLVESLMAIESRPKDLLEARIATLTAERTAFLQLNALILAAQSAASQFEEVDFFGKASAATSNEDVMVATAEAGALPGSYSFAVHSLVSTHQMISSGFASLDGTRVGSGTITVESALGRVDRSADLDALNDGAGVRRGVISITDRSGAGAEIDLTAALDIRDVLEAINSQSAADVKASVSGGHLVLTDGTGLTTGNLVVSDVGLGQTASDLGIAGNATDGILIGDDVVYLTDDTALSFLNDGNGIRTDGSLEDFRIELRDGATIDVGLSGHLRNETRLVALNDGAGVRDGSIRITDRAGNSADVDLTGAETIGDVLTAINDEGLGLNVSAITIDGHLVLTDSTAEDDVVGEFSVEDVDGGHTAGDLGLSESVDGDTLTGSDIYDMDTLGDVIRAINLDGENDGSLVASISSDRQGIVLTDTSAGSGTTTVTNIEGSVTQAAEDLGILGSWSDDAFTSRDLIAGLDTVLLRTLNGGTGVGLGTISVTARDGTASTIDLTGASTLQDVIDAINAVSDTSDVSASVNDSGNGIALTDLSGGSGYLVVADVTGTAAEDLNLLIDDAVDEVDSGNLQRQYINENTQLDDLRGGQGISRGRFTITDSTGASATIDLSQGNEVTLADAIAEINARTEIGVVASINATGDGLLLTDTAGGTLELTVVDEDSSTAEDLGIAGVAEEGETTLDGSFEVQIEIESGDTLADVISKINNADAGVTASVLNDGSSTNPYRLILAGELSGRQGEMIVDTGGIDLSFSTLVRARDAVVSMGEVGSPNSLLLTSGSNTLDGVIPDVKIDLLATSDEPVTINVSKDVDGITSSIQTFVSTFNSILDGIDDLTSFDSETYEKGMLFGDSTVERIRSRLYGMLRTTVETGGVYSRLNDVGLSLGSGATLRFDEEEFRQALTENPEDVMALFSQDETGLGHVIQDALEALTEDGTGLIDRHNKVLSNQEELLSDRVEELEILLDAKEERLLNEFYAMEEALSRLSTMESALTVLSSIQTGTSSSTSSLYSS